MTAVTPPASNKNKIFAVVVVFALIALGVGVVYLQNSPAPPMTSTSFQPIVPTEYGSISNANISVTELFNDIGGLYFGSSVDQALHIQLFTGTLTERLTNVTLDLEGSPLGVPSLMVSQGTLTAQIVPAGLSLTFQGEATSPGSTYVLTSFSFIYSSPMSTTTARSATAQASMNLNAAFTAIIPPALVNAIQSAISSSPDPATQVQSLASYLSSAGYSLGSIPGFTGQGYQEAAAFILYSATLGTSLANNVYLRALEVLRVELVKTFHHVHPFRGFGNVEHSSGYRRHRCNQFLRLLAHQ